MSIYDTQPRAAPVEACACCGAPADSVVWGQSLCVDCSGAWLTTPGFDAGDVGLELSADALASECRRLTAEWVRRRSAALRAGEAA